MHHLGTVSKNILTGGLKLVLWYHFMVNFKGVQKDGKMNGWTECQVL